MLLIVIVLVIELVIVAASIAHGREEKEQEHDYDHEHEIFASCRISYRSGQAGMPAAYAIDCQSVNAGSFTILPPASADSCAQRPTHVQFADLRAFG